jgi:hypothetical protein
MRDIDFGPVAGVPTEHKPDTFGDIFEADRQDAIKVSNLNARRRNFEDAYDRVNDRIKEATGAQLESPYLKLPLAPEPNEDAFKKWRDQVNDLAAKHPGKLQWDAILDEPHRIATQTMFDQRQASNDLEERLNLYKPENVPLFGRTRGISPAQAPLAAPFIVGSNIISATASTAANIVTSPRVMAARLAGSLVGQMYSPVDALANLIGFGAGHAAKSLVKNALINGAVNAGVQAPMSYAKQSDYQEAGLPYGWKVWLAEVEGAAGMGIGLDAAIRGPSRAILRRYGRDVAPDQLFSRNTVRGGWLQDAIAPGAETRLPARPEPIVDAETARRAEAGDITAQKAILEKTGMMEDPAVRGAVRNLEVGEKLTESQLETLEKMGVPRSAGLGMLHEAIVEGGRVAPRVEPVRAPDAALVPDDARALATEHSAKIDALRQELGPRIATAIDDGLDAGIPRIVAAVRAAVDGEPGGMARRFVGHLEANGGAARAINEAALHGLRGSPAEMAHILRTDPTILDASMPLDVPAMRQARSIAALDEAAVQQMHDLRIPPEVAAYISDTVPAVHQAQVMADIAKVQPKSMQEAREMVRRLAPLPERDAPRQPKSVIPDKPEAELEALRKAAGPEHERIQQNIEAREKIDSEVETIRGEVAKLEEALREAEPSRFNAADGVSRETSGEQTSATEPTTPADDARLVRLREQLAKAEKQAEKDKAEFNYFTDP